MRNSYFYSLSNMKIKHVYLESLITVTNDELHYFISNTSYNSTAGIHKNIFDANSQKRHR